MTEIEELKARCAELERERDATQEQLVGAEMFVDSCCNDIARLNAMELERGALKAKLATATAIITRLRSKLHDKCDELSYHAMACANCNMADQLRGSLGSQIEHERRKLTAAVEALRRIIFCIDHDNLAEDSSWLQMEIEHARAILAGHAPAPATSQQAAPNERERLIEALDIIEQEAGDANKSRNDPWAILARIENIASAALADTTKPGGE